MPVWLVSRDVGSPLLVWDGGIPRPPGRRPRSAASLRSLRAALENASRFLSSAPLRVRIPLLAHKKALQVHKGLERCVLKGWAAETYGEHLHVRPALRFRRRGGVTAPHALGPVQPAPDRLGDCLVRVGTVVAVGTVRAARDTVGDQPALVLLDGAAVHLAALNAAELRVNLAAHLLLQRQHHVRADALARFRPFDTAIRGPEVGLVGEPLAGDHAVHGRA